MSYKSTENYRQ